VEDEKAAVLSEANKSSSIDLSLDGLAAVNCSIWVKIAAAKKKASVAALVAWAVTVLTRAAGCV
jgi:hypothetical protein